MEGTILPQLLNEQTTGIPVQIKRTLQQLQQVNKEKKEL
jgi:hypothetical protein